MIRRSRKFLSIMMSALLIGNIVTIKTVAADNVEVVEVLDINPTVQKLEKIGNGFSITDTVTIIGEDDANKNALRELKELLTGYGIKTTTKIDVNNTIIAIGEFLGEEADEKIKELIKGLKLEEDVALTKEEGYVVYTSKGYDEVKKGIIAIAGTDGDGTLYGVNTLEQLLQNNEVLMIPEVKISDYSDTKTRGIVEGFYGDQWSHEARKSLLEFSGKQKMNTYIYGPKDDPYHKEKWREPYPEEEEAKLTELIKVAEENGVDFNWAIHPGGSITFTEEDYRALLAKLETVYNMGARAFAVFFDDIGGPGADAGNQAEFLNRINNDFIKVKGDILPLVMCPTQYNKWWSGGDYLDVLGNNLDSDIQIMWTGDKVMSDITKESMDWVNNRVKREVLVWWNYPVNDYCRDRLLLGEAYGLDNDVDNISGVVSNPMSHAQASKLALYSVADYSWNIGEYDSFDSWEKAIEHLVPEVQQEFKIFAKHNSDAYTDYHQYRRKESVNMIEPIKQFKENIKSGISVKESSQIIIDEFKAIENAGKSILANCKDEALLEDVNLWVSSFEQLGIAGSNVIESILALEENDYGSWWESYSKGKIALDVMNKIDAENRQDQTQKGVKVATYLLSPFIKEMFKESEKRYIEAVDLEAPTDMELKPIASYTNLSILNNMIDGDDTTYSYIQTQQKNGDYYGVDLGKVAVIKDISILQGINDTHHDIFNKGILEYSIDGQNWSSIGEERSGFKIEENNVGVEARYVRYRLTHAGIPGGKPDLWTAIREFKVDTKSSDKNYTNIDGLKNLEITKGEIGEIKYQQISNLEMEKDDYIGFELSTLNKTDDITLKLDGNSLQNIDLEYSINGLEWIKLESSIVNGIIKSNTNITFKYVRAINKGEEVVTGKLNDFSIWPVVKIDPVATTEGTTISSGNANNLIDGNKDTFLETGSQITGQYYQVDLGAEVSLYDITVYSNSSNHVISGILEVSKNGELWNPLNDFSSIPQANPMRNFMSLEATDKYNEIKAEANGEKYRYIRLRVTGDDVTNVKIHEIAFNESIIEDKVSVVEGSPGGEFNKVADNKIDTAYKAERQPKEGEYLLYRMTDVKPMNNILIMQDSNSISNAKVSVRTISNRWIEVGILDKSFTNIDLKQLIDIGEEKKVLDIKLTWDPMGATPKIYEITPIYKEIDIEDSLLVEATITVDKEVMKIGNTSNIALLGKSSNGSSVDMSDAEVTYISSNKEVANVVNGVINALAEGTTEISAIVNLNGIKLETNKVIITVESENIVIDKVKDLQTNNITSETLELTWGEPNSIDGLIEYLIYIDGKFVDSVPTGSNSYLVNNLKRNTIYGFKVTAKYSNGKESKPKSINVRSKK